jgi:arsenic resistance protein ArsH
MWTIPNQSSLPFAWKSFTEQNRLMSSSNRDRLVDVCEELMCVRLRGLPAILAGARGFD